MRGNQQFILICITVTLFFCIFLLISPRTDEQVEIIAEYLTKMKQEESAHVHDDRHMKNIDLSGRIQRTPYPKSHYHVAQNSLKCYLKGTNYDLVMVDLDNDTETQANCRHHKHAKNSDFAYNFIKKWANWEFVQPPNWNGADNGVLQDIKNCDTIWRQGKDFQTYMAYVTCCKIALGKSCHFSKEEVKVQLDCGLENYAFIDERMVGWCENDFMFHGWKAVNISQGGWVSPFEVNDEKHLNFQSKPDPAICDASPRGWPWRESKKSNVRAMLSRFENRSGKSFPRVARIHPYLELPDVGECYPDCDANT